MATSRRREKRRCPDCGNEMNYHALRLLEPRTREDAKHVDPELGAVREEVHCCATCGKNVALRD
jgi:ribosomal protein S27AE